MESNFWLDTWNNDDIGFHRENYSSLLLTHFNMLKLETGDRVFVPLCGKTRDISWFLSQDIDVVAAELSEKAVVQLFSELGIEPEIHNLDSLIKYSAKNIDVYVGDVFKVTHELLGPVDAVFDRAALVALPKPMRDSYTKHIAQLTHNAPQLLIVYEYDQSLMDGPPFSITEAEINKYYGRTHKFTLLESLKVEGAFKNACEANENIWFLDKIDI